jgi:hypothetical protein
VTRRLSCKDIPDEVFLTAVSVAAAAGSAGTWALRWDVATLLEASGWPLPEKLLLAKARKLINQGKMGGCWCGCRGDFERQAP